MDESWEWTHREALAMAREEHLFYDFDETDLEWEDLAFMPADGDEIFGSHEPVVGGLIDMADLFLGYQAHNTRPVAPARPPVRPHLVVLSVYNPMQTA